ncbi:hypothetical protein [Nesterenkonia alkaliphila]|uniref:Uncharacterized protein n=1 Tax=Nesterenkonia alkaliphila TaxID=1463631 RepID=A0A7K1UL59_9MICC|nr:hypothetical protein [Nesterenkonia alkaliphila]MVT27166.1 hypothetical protein [Nesterenkonia alkaliphila]GFZ98195.1 hypothetical protein GCM10011359_29230 [Nesterenkonia alkaliphila]
MPGSATEYASNLRGLGRLLRGLIIGLVAVTSTALAHYLITGHAPAMTTALVAFAATTPVAIALSRIPKSRCRLALAVIPGQVFLHALFGPGGSTGLEDHQHQLLVHTEPGALLVHLGALAVTYAAIRRGDDLVEVLFLVLQLSLLRPLPATPRHVTYPVHVPVGETAWVPAESRPGEGLNPLRGPPLLSV